MSVISSWPFQDPGSQHLGAKADQSHTQEYATDHERRLQLLNAPSLLDAAPGGLGRGGRLGGVLPLDAVHLVPDPLVDEARLLEPLDDVAELVGEDASLRRPQRHLEGHHTLPDDVELRISDSSKKGSKDGERRKTHTSSGS